MSEAKKNEIRNEMNELQVWFAGHTRNANPQGWDDRSEYYDELNDKLCEE